MVLGATATAAAVGWIAGRTIHSPAEVAARTAPPQASPILVPIEKRQLTNDVVLRGTARFGSPQKLSVASSALKPNAGIVSDTVLAGTELREGSLALTASGRPLFVLTGARPMSRDLGPGMFGDDVRGLEQALKRLSFDPGPVDGLYDAATEAAVEAFYQRGGFAAFRATTDQLNGVRARESTALSAQADALASADALETATAAVTAARAALDEATIADAAAPGEVDRARAVSALQVRIAEAEVSAARAALDALARQSPTEGQLSAAQRDLTVALAQADTARISGVRSITDAEAAAGRAQREVVTRQAALHSAELQRANAQALATAKSNVAQRADVDAAIAKALAGVQVPADEIVFVSTAPVRVSEVLLSKGDQLNKAVFSVTDAVVSVDSGLALKDAPLIKQGMAVKIDEPSIGISASGVVKRVAPAAGTNGVDGFHVYFEVGVDAPPANLAGASVRLTIAVESTAAQVLAVPLSAVTMAPDGSSRVQRHTASGSNEFIVVKPGLVAAGYVAVEGDLSAGELVVVGFEAKRPAGA